MENTTRVPASTKSTPASNPVASRWLSGLTNEQLLALWRVLLAGRVSDKRMQAMLVEMQTRGIGIQ